MRVAAFRSMLVSIVTVSVSPRGIARLVATIAAVNRTWPGNISKVSSLRTFSHRVGNGANRDLVGLQWLHVLARWTSGSSEFGPLRKGCLFRKGRVEVC